jgi:hypothetical protein
VKSQGEKVVENINTVGYDYQPYILLINNELIIFIDEIEKNINFENRLRAFDHYMHHHHGKDYKIINVFSNNTSTWGKFIDLVNFFDKKIEAYFGKNIRYKQSVKAT